MLNTVGPLRLAQEHIPSSTRDQELNETEKGPAPFKSENVYWFG